MRSLAKSAQERLRQHLVRLGSVRVSACDPPGTCPVCSSPLGVQKTLRRSGRTLEHGPFEIVETVHVCRAGCQLPSGAPVVRRAASLAERIPPGATVGYDVIVRIGRLRFVEYRQREEIREILRLEHGVTLSSGEVSSLAVRFLCYLEALHAARAGDLRAVLATDGGWPLHIDATGENGRGTLLIAYTGWRGWVLGSWKIPTERADAVLPRLRAVVARFGPPCAILRDLGRAMTDAGETLVQEIGADIPILACHLHFARDVGKDLLGELHDQLRALFRQADVRKPLRVLARDLGRRLGTRIGAARDALRLWQAADVDGHMLPDGDAGLATVRALAQWVLDFATDGSDEGFPFDVPYLDLYRRCRKACRAVDAFLRTPPADADVRKAIARLRLALRPTESEVPFEQTARRLKIRAQIFTELRDALRLGVRPGRRCDGRPGGGLAGEQIAQLQDVQAAIAQLEVSLHKRRPARGPAQDERAAIDTVLAHLNRHGNTLFGHAIELPGGIRLVDRTNNELEGFNHALKHGERRRSGRKVLTQDFEKLPPAVALARNLTRPDYVEILCGSLEQLPMAFAQLDAANHRRSVVALSASPEACMENEDIEAASFPALDRHLVRTEEMGRRIHAAALSRPPRPTFATAV